MSLNLFLPGWGIQPEACRPLWERVCAPGNATVFDYGFFKPGASFNFNDDQKVLDAAAAPGQLVLGGHSLGALIALRIAAHYPERVAALILFASFARFSAAPGYPGRDESGIDAMRRQLASAPSAVLKSFYRTMFLPAKSSLSAPVAPNAQILQEGLAFLSSCDLRDELEKIKCPVLLINGMHDAISPPPMAGFVAKSLACRAQDISIEDAGHAVLFTHPDACAEAVQSFLSDVIEG